MRRITLDIETEGVFTGGLPDFSELEITVVGIHDTHGDKYSCFTKDELGALWPMLESADMLVGYNSEHFDIPILNKYYAGDLSKSRVWFFWCHGFNQRHHSPLKRSWHLLGHTDFRIKKLAKRSGLNFFGLASSPFSNKLIDSRHN